MELATYTNDVRQTGLGGNEQVGSDSRLIDHQYADDVEAGEIQIFGTNLQASLSKQTYLLVAKLQEKGPGDLEHFKPQRTIAEGRNMKRHIARSFDHHRIRFHLDRPCAGVRFRFKPDFFARGIDGQQRLRTKINAQPSQVAIVHVERDHRHQSVHRQFGLAKYGDDPQWSQIDRGVDRNRHPICFNLDAEITIDRKLIH